MPSTDDEPGSTLDIKEIFKDSQLTKDEDPETWMRAVRDKLFSIFCSPVKEEYTSEAFKWVSHLCVLFKDLTWISPDGKWSDEESKIFVCIASLAITELHILLPLLQRHLTCGEEPELEEGRILARSANSHDYDKFGSHLIILESVIKSLVKGQELNDNDETKFNSLAGSIKGQILSNLLERLKDFMTSICEYLETVHHQWETLVKEPGSMKLTAAQGALRIVSVWLSEDPESFEPQCKRFLIDLLVKNLMLTNSGAGHDILILALHSVCLQNRDALRHLKQVPKYREALETYLMYVQREGSKSGSRRNAKCLKLRCGLVKDLMSDGSTRSD